MTNLFFKQISAIIATKLTRYQIVKIEKLLKCIPGAYELALRIKKKSDRNHTDIYILSYPKSGRTWLRLMIGRMLVTHFALPEQHALELTPLGFLHENVPIIRLEHGDHPDMKNPSEIDGWTDMYNTKPVIFLLRDPRDVILSLYYQHMKRDKLFKGTLEEFIHKKCGGFETLIKYLEIMARESNNFPKFLLVRYEDLQTNTLHELKKIARFLGFSDIAEQTIKEAIEYSSFDNMKKLEMSERFYSSRLAPKDPNDYESYKTRKRKVGSSKTEFPAQLYNELTDIIQPRLPKTWGYR